MPVQLIAETVPVLLSLVQFDLDQGEGVFLTYSRGREHGPEIQRSGRASPCMEHLYPKYPGETTSHPDGLRLRSWLIQNNLRKKDLDYGKTELERARARGAPADTIRVLDDYIRENSRLAAHDAEFANVYPDHEIVGHQGCGDLTMNLWNVAFVNSPLALRGRPAPIFLHKEPLAQRTYSCLVKWKAAHGQRAKLTIEDLRFFGNASTADETAWALRTGTWERCGQQIEFAVSSRKVIRDGNLVDVSRLTHQFSDLRHLLRMPNLNHKEILFAGDSGKPRYYFGRTTTDDIWFGEAQLMDDVNLQRAAMMGPVFLSRLYEGLGASVEQVKGAMARADYEEVTAPWEELREGQFRFVPEDDSRVEVCFRRNCYGWSMVGLNRQNDKVLCLACEGNPDQRRGHVLEDAVRKLLLAGAYNALLIDEGADVFQNALLGHGPKIRLAGDGTALTVTIAPKRTRLRSTFIFARAKTEVSPNISPTGVE